MAAAEVIMASLNMVTIGITTMEPKVVGSGYEFSRCASCCLSILSSIPDILRNNPQNARLRVIGQFLRQPSRRFTLNSSGVGFGWCGGCRLSAQLVKFGEELLMVCCGDGHGFVGGRRSRRKLRQLGADASRIRSEEH